MNVIKTVNKVLKKVGSSGEFIEYQEVPESAYEKELGICSCGQQLDGHPSLCSECLADLANYEEYLKAQGEHEAFTVKELLKKFESSVRLKSALQLKTYFTISKEEHLQAKKSSEQEMSDRDMDDVSQDIFEAVATNNYYKVHEVVCTALKYFSNSSGYIIRELLEAINHHENTRSR